jgi:uncharacterized protein YcsI (UPF0317 family)
VALGFTEELFAQANVVNIKADYAFQFLGFVR